MQDTVVGQPSSSSSSPSQSTERERLVRESLGATLAVVEAGKTRDTRPASNLLSSSLLLVLVQLTLLTLLISTISLFHYFPYVYTHIQIRVRV